MSLTRSRRARSAAIAMTITASLTLAACASEDAADNDITNADTATTVDAATTTAGDDSAQPAESTNSTQFAIPTDYAEALAAAGIELADIDFPKQPDGVAWPTDEWPRGEASDPAVAAQLDATLQRAFTEYSNEANTIDAVLVVKDGVLVAEGYHPNWDPSAVHNSWSMAKSMTSAFVGVLADQGKLDIFAPVNAPEWSEAGDPRQAITLQHLLHMASGLQWTEEYFDGTSDVIAILGDDGDRAGYTASKPLEHEPGTVFEYSTGTSNLIARSIANVVGFGETLTTWMRDSLFGPIGIGTVEHSLDSTGLVSGGSWYKMTAQDFARFGYLFLRGGTWDGKQVLSRDWINFSWTPSIATPEGEDADSLYGAQWWMPKDRPGVYAAYGFDGQRIVISPEHDLVVVVLSFDRSGSYRKVVDEILDAFGVSAAG